MHILIAPNAFKNSLSSEDAAAAIRSGFEKSRLDCRCECFPIADGGDGTGGLIIKKCGGTLIHLEVFDPLKRRIRSSFGLIDQGKTAVIEMADASGLRLLAPDELDPLTASSFGTGEMIRHALDKGVNKIIVAMGGSATVDGGCGILSALGVRFLDSKGMALSGMPESLTNLAKIDLSEFDDRILSSELVVLCDVDNHLLGGKGSAAVFGPQKGATPDGVKKLESSLSKFRDIVLKQTGKDIARIEYGGTAGGAAAGLHAFFNAKLVNGISYFLELTEFDASLSGSDLVITGEGSIDKQTLSGKGPFGVAYRAKLKHIPVVGLAGRIPLKENEQISSYFNILLSIGNEASDLATALSHTAENLTRTSKELGNLLALFKQ